MRDVWNYMFIVKRTVDVDILQMRTSTRLLESDDPDKEKDRFLPKHEDELTDREKEQQWGTAYVKASDEMDFL